MQSGASPYWLWLSAAIRLAVGHGAIRNSTWRLSRALLEPSAEVLLSMEAFSGVALWLPPGVTPDEAALVSVLQDTVGAAQRDALFSMFEQMNAFHPREAHWHLPLIGVDPAHQGKGVGAALLRRVLDACDSQKMLAYLEATSVRNVPLYERHGFEALGRIQVADSPPVVPMVRKPR